MSQPPRMAPRPNRKTRPLIAREPMLKRPSPPSADTTSNTPPIKARTKARSDSSLCIFKGIFNLMVPKNPRDPDNNSTDLNKGKNRLFLIRDNHPCDEVRREHSCVARVGR